VRTKNAVEATVADETATGSAVGAVMTDAVNGFVAALSGDDVRRLQNDPNVTAIERDTAVTIAADQINPPWGLDRLDQVGLPLSNTYSYGTTGSGVTAYIVDTGIRSTHNEFAGRIARGAYIDWADGMGVEDCNGHGTHVAGTIGGTTYGVAKLVQLVPMKVFACNGVTTSSSVVIGLDWVAKDHLAGVPAVLNLSLGSVASPAFDAAVNAVIADGVTVVVAAGNDASDACNYSPARVTTAITVGATQVDDSVAGFSNYGPCLDLFAPGSSVLSAWKTSDTSSATISGTSMATPHVTGTVARLLQARPTDSPAQVWAALDAASTAGAVRATHSGDPNKLVHLTPTAMTLPDAPRRVSGVAGNAHVSLWWSAPWFDAGLPVFDYVVQYRPVGGSWSTFADGASAGTAAIVTGLTNETSYEFQVAAVNAAGTGPMSAPSGPLTTSSSGPTSPALAPASTTGFTALDPVRLFDTRPGEPQGVVPVLKTRYGGSDVLTIRIPGIVGVPQSGVSAVSLNVTVVDPVGSGFVTVYPCGERPLASSLNFVAGQIVPNAVIAPLSANGDLCVFSSVETHVIADINGWFTSGFGFTALPPARVFDTRPDEVQGAVVVSKQPYGELKVKVTGAAGVPAAGVDAVSLNVTVVDPAGSGFVTVYPCGERPLASSLNYVTDEVTPNAVIAHLSPDGEVCFYSSVAADLVADVNGWFAEGPAFVALPPVRVFDTRPDAPQGAVGVGQQYYGGANVLAVRVTGVAGVPESGVSAVSLNVTVTRAIGAGFVTVYPCGERPLASSLNYVTAEIAPNAVIVPVSSDGDICLYSSVDAHLLADVNGWFAG
jgi:subtilisin family serine protease